MGAAFLAVSLNAPVSAQGAQPESQGQPDAYNQLMGSPTPQEGAAQAPVPSDASPTGSNMTYNAAMQAYLKTKEHSQAVQDWGARRTLKVPAGARPEDVIRQQMLKVPGVDGIDEAPITQIAPLRVDAPLPPQQEAAETTQVTLGKNVTTKTQLVDPAAIANPATRPVGMNEATNEAGGWDWYSKGPPGAQNAAAPNAAGQPVQPVQPGQPVQAGQQIQQVQRLQQTQPAAAAPVRRAAPPQQIRAARPQQPAVPSRYAGTNSSLQTVFQANGRHPSAGAVAAARRTIANNSGQEVLELDMSKAGGAPQQQAAPAQQPAPAQQGAAPAAQQPAAPSLEEMYRKAVKLHLSGKLDEAIAEYRAILATNPELSQAHCNLGLIYNQQHNYDLALAEFRKALAINPKDAITYNGIGAALRAQEKFDEAIKNWQTAITLDPKLATAQYNLGTAYEIKKDYDKALDCYQQAVKSDYKLGEAHYRMGLIMARTNRLQEARDAFEKALEVSSQAEYCDDARQHISAIDKKIKVQ